MCNPQQNDDIIKIQFSRATRYCQPLQIKLKSNLNQKLSEGSRKYIYDFIILRLECSMTRLTGMN